ncbi:CheR family methyltransferase [Metabacillus lacus]|uniref:CheR family methyltransferase n=1 Tax=Metabacillus lacus TaxID=1983721 RepID=UPI001FEAA272|nr:protein-glutamate O-methyltransferase CheR [Metabacillus lacus]
MGKILNDDERQQLEIDLLLQGVYLSTGYDFRKYMRSSIERRLENRMRLEQISSITGVLEKVLHEPGFVDKLLSDFSINVTEMFRDPSFFYAFRRDVIPMLRQHSEIRIWHAGCATGEEAYSMAIMLHEEGLLGRTRIYATDMNEQVVKLAERGAFSLNRMQTYTKNYLQSGGSSAFSEYYSTDEQNASFHRYLADSIIFAQHNLVTDGSFNEFHAIICRNVLIYFSGGLQTDVTKLFYDSLASNGFLCLGSKEALRPDARYNYRTFNSKEKIYRKENYIT